MKLPPLDPVAKNQSNAFIEYFKKIIDREGRAVSFSRFMQAALYGENVGFYTLPHEIFGARGDFLTAPEISPLFAQSLAIQCEQILKVLGGGSIVELGAGSGIFAKDLITTLEKRLCLPEKYYIYEISQPLRERQQAFLRMQCPEFFPRIQWLDSLENFKMSGIIVANEVLDALPVDIFRIKKHVIQEKFVTVQGQQLYSFYAAPQTQGLKLKVEKLRDDYQLPSEYESEINMILPAWLQTIAAALQHGVMLFVDYGYDRQTYYHPDRTMGTLMCYYQHLKHADPFIYPGLQDITAHVDFTTITETSGLEVAGFTTQAEFLIALGILSLVEEVQDVSVADQFRNIQALKKLIFPHEMGEAIKVMALTKDFDEPLLGFSGRSIRRL